MDTKNFALRVAQLRIKKGVSARDMSLSMGQNPGYITNIESGHSKPSIDGFFYICEYLQISPQEFFDTDNTNPQKLQDILGNLKRLNDRQLDMVADLVKDLAK